MLRVGAVAVLTGLKRLSKQLILGAAVSLSGLYVLHEYVLTLASCKNYDMLPNRLPILHVRSNTLLLLHGYVPNSVAHKHVSHPRLPEAETVESYENLWKASTPHEALHTLRKQAAGSFNNQDGSLWCL